MIPTTTASCCPDCGCTRVIDAGRGLTCTACGLVIDETPSFVISDQRDKEGVVSSHSILHVNTTTLIGAIRERGAGNGARLSRIQQRTVSYQDAKESRVYHLVSAATANAQLPAIVVDHAVHAARKIAALAPRRSSMAGSSMTAALAVFVACKKLGITRPRDEWLAMAASMGIEGKPFLRNIMRLRAMGKSPGKEARKGARAGGATVVNVSLAALRDAVGPGDHLPVVRLVHAGIARALVGMRVDSAAAVTAFLAGQLLSPAGVPLTLLARTTKFRAASMYNAVKRVLAKIGMVVEGPLSKARLCAVLRSRMLVGGGVVKEVPVPLETALPEIEATATATETLIPAAGTRARAPVEAAEAVRYRDDGTAPRRDRDRAQPAGAGRDGGARWRVNRKVSQKHAATMAWARRPPSRVVTRPTLSFADIRMT
ncbi:MAG: hypothetical protein GYA24_04170 [Candidatus Lokiarchaeota archaeon]|nr:hypothetical protein [Candidatus Lokiarchaeota archaeon]